MVKEAAELAEMIQNQKEKYFYDLSLKLNNPQTSTKTYWSRFKSCYNGSGITIIPPLSLEGKNITNFKEEKPIFSTSIFHLNVIFYQMTVSYQKIKHILQKQN